VIKGSYEIVIITDTIFVSVIYKYFV